MNGSQIADALFLLYRVVWKYSWERLAKILCHSAFLGRATEHFKGDSLNLAWMFLHNSVQGWWIHNISPKNMKPFFLFYHDTIQPTKIIILVHLLN